MHCFTAKLGSGAAWTWEKGNPHYYRTYRPPSLLPKVPMEHLGQHLAWLGAPHYIDCLPEHTPSGAAYTASGTTLSPNPPGSLVVDIVIR